MKKMKNARNTKSSKEQPQIQSKEPPFERQSGFNGNCESYLDANFSYVYEFQVLQDDGSYAAGKETVPYTEEMREIFICLDGNDHDFDLIERYEDENADGIFRRQQLKRGSGEYRCCGGGGAYFAEDPVNEIPDRDADVFTEAFPEYAETPPEDTVVNELRKWIFSLPENQQNLIFAHFGEMKFLEEIRREEELETGRKISKQAMHNRWNKILAKACKRFGVEKPKQEHRKLSRNPSP